MNDACANLLQLVGQLDTFRHDGTLCDVTVLIVNEPERDAHVAAKCEDSGETPRSESSPQSVIGSFHCHRCVLAASSSYWRSMFAHDVRETRTCTVRFDSHIVTPRAFGRLLDFVYTGQLLLPAQLTLTADHDEQETCDNAAKVEQATTENVDRTIEVLELLHAAHLLAYDSVVTRCATFLESSIDTRNCELVHRLANLLGLTELSQRTHRFIVQHFAAIYIDQLSGSNEQHRQPNSLSLSLEAALRQPDNEETQRLVELSRDQLAAYAADDELAVASETDLLAFVFRFFAARAKRGLALRGDDLCAVLKHVRLDCVPVDVLRRFHAAFGAVFASDQPELQHVAALFNEAVLFNSVESDARSLQRRSNGAVHNRRPPRASTIKRDSVVLVGGFADTSVSLRNAPADCAPLADTTVRVFNAQRNVWHTLTNLPTTVRWCTAVAVSNCLYVLGGLVRPGADAANRGRAILTDAVWRFDALRNRWTECAVMPRVRAQHCACVIGTHIYVLGGVTRRDAAATDATSAKQSPSRSSRECDVVDGEPDVRLCTEIDCFDTVTGVWMTVGASSQTRRLSHLVPISLLAATQCEYDDDLAQRNGGDQRLTAAGCTAAHNGERAARNGPANCTHALIEIGGLRTPSQSTSIDTFEYYTVTGPYVLEACASRRSEAVTVTQFGTVANANANGEWANSISKRSLDANMAKCSLKNDSLTLTQQAEQVVRVDSAGEHFVLPETLCCPLAVAFDENTLLLLCEQTRKLVSFEPKRRTYKRLPDLPTARIGCTLVVCNARLYVLGGYARVTNTRRSLSANMSAPVGVNENANASSNTNTNSQDAFHSLVHAQAHRTVSNGRDAALTSRLIDAFRYRLAAFSDPERAAHAEQFESSEADSVAEKWLPSVLVECFDPATEQWRVVPEMQLPTARAYHSAVTLRF